MIPQLTAEEATELFFEEVVVAYSMSYGVPVGQAETLVRSYYSRVTSAWGDDYFHHEGVDATVWEVHGVAVQGMEWGEKRFHEARLRRNATDEPLPERFGELSPSDRRDVLLRRDRIREARGGGSGWLP